MFRQPGYLAPNAAFRWRFVNAWIPDLFLYPLPKVYIFSVITLPNLNWKLSGQKIVDFHTHDHTMSNIRAICWENLLISVKFTSDFVVKLSGQTLILCSGISLPNLNWKLSGHKIVDFHTHGHTLGNIRAICWENLHISVKLTSDFVVKLSGQKLIEFTF